MIAGLSPSTKLVFLNAEARRSTAVMGWWNLRLRRWSSKMVGNGSRSWIQMFKEQSKSSKKLKKKEGSDEQVEVEESVHGGEDLWDAGAVEDSGRFPDHLVVMVNGLVGSSEDWKYGSEQFVMKYPDKVIVHRSECNHSKLTFDGIDVMGDRLAEEVRSVVNSRRGVRKISFVTHSLGGLIARYAVGRLYEPVAAGKSEDPLTDDENIEGRIAGLEPINFITFATPHLGSVGKQQLPFLCGVPFLERRASKTAHLIVGRTGNHLFLTDNDDGRPPLLLRMAYNSDDIKFISALHSFKRRVAYANVNYDHMVGWRTSSIRRQHELPKYRLLVSNEKYPHIVHVDKREQYNVRKREFLNAEVMDSDLEEAMIQGLSQVPWERVDVSFKKSRQKYIAHTTIQVKSYWFNSDGADVILHMIDNFLI